MKVQLTLGMEDHMLVIYQKNLFVFAVIIFVTVTFNVYGHQQGEDQSSMRFKWAGEIDSIVFRNLQNSDPLLGDYLIRRRIILYG